MRINNASREYFPNMVKYLEKYGQQKLPPPQNIPRRFWKPNVDYFYKYLLENELRWEEVVSGEDGV